MKPLTREQCREAGDAVARDIQTIAGTRWPFSLLVVARDAWRVRSARAYIREWDGIKMQTICSRVARRQTTSLRLMLVHIRLAITARLFELWPATAQEIVWVAGYSSLQSFTRHVRKVRGLRLADWRRAGYVAEIELLRAILNGPTWPADLFRVERNTPPTPAITTFGPPLERVARRPDGTTYPVLTPELVAVRLTHWALTWDRGARAA